MVRVNRAAVTEAVKMFESLKGLAIKGDVKLSETAAKNLTKAGGVKKALKKITEPSLSFNYAIKENSVIGDVLIKDGKEVYAKASGEITLPEDKEGFFEIIEKILQKRKGPKVEIPHFETPSEFGKADKLEEYVKSLKKAEVSDAKVAKSKALSKPIDLADKAKTEKNSNKELKTKIDKFINDSNKV